MTPRKFNSNQTSAERFSSFVMCTWIMSSQVYEDTSTLPATRKKIKNDAFVIFTLQPTCILSTQKAPWYQEEKRSLPFSRMENRQRGEVVAFVCTPWSPVFVLYRDK